MNILSDFSERLLELLKEKDLNSEILGKQINVSPTAIRYWCKAEKDIRLSNLIKLANYFNCSLDYLCKRTENYLDYTPKILPVFTEWFPNLLKENGTTSYKLFKDTHLKNSYFTQWRKGSEPLLSSLEVLANYLDCSIDKLVGRDR